jgi:hypothetical protein
MDGFGLTNPSSQRLWGSLNDASVAAHNCPAGIGTQDIVCVDPSGRWDGGISAKGRAVARHCALWVDKHAQKQPHRNGVRWR